MIGQLEVLIDKIFKVCRLVSVIILNFDVDSFEGSRIMARLRIICPLRSTGDSFVRSSSYNQRIRTDDEGIAIYSSEYLMSLLYSMRIRQRPGGKLVALV